ncbi:MAG: glycoside hydrolase family 9 protein [Ignavibacteriae bacterium]|nr:glycoside hydrolase family 9 protein [Ignavibacteriota bacterium]
MKSSDKKNILRWSVFLPVILLISVFYFFRTNVSSAGGNNKQDTLIIDQLGYRPYDVKIAFVRAVNPDSFVVKNAATNEIVFKGKPNNKIEFDRTTGDNLYPLNFSSLTRPGVYKISVPALSVTSYQFSIGSNVYNECAEKTIQSYYYQRCGAEISNGTKWAHPACHLKNAKFLVDPSKEMNTKGGWHDAGDYNKFVPTTAVSAAFLLYAYEDFPDFFYDGQLNIPESHNSIPDVLDEACFALEWLIKMQRGDGAVYHKVSIKNWTGEHLPDKETEEQYIFGISSTSTADVAAVAALGARLLEKYNKPLSVRLLKCAVDAWHFLQSNPEIIPQGGFKNPAGVEGGEYGDEIDSDERLWASIELFRLTGSEEYINYFLSNYQKVGGPNYTLSWKNTANFAYYSFLKLYPFPQGIDHQNNIKARATILSNMNTYCNQLLERIELGGYRCALNNDEYYWGSNSVVAGYAYDLTNLYRVTDQRKYFDAALDQLHYLLGRNTFGISFITGIGAAPVKHPYHQFSMLKYHDNPVPGLLVAGPNSYSRLNGKIISQMPGKSYEDFEKNYFVNEVAINYTAPLVYVASFFSQPLDNSISKKNSNDSNMETK